MKKLPIQWIVIVLIIILFSCLASVVCFGQKKDSGLWATNVQLDRVYFINDSMMVRLFVSKEGDFFADTIPIKSTLKSKWTDATNAKRDTMVITKIEKSDNKPATGIGNQIILGNGLTDTRVLGRFTESTIELWDGANRVAYKKKDSLWVLINPDKTRIVLDSIAIKMFPKQ